MFLAKNDVINAIFDGKLTLFYHWKEPNLKHNTIKTFATHFNLLLKFASFYLLNKDEMKELDYIMAPITKSSIERSSQQVCNYYIDI